MPSLPRKQIDSKPHRRPDYSKADKIRSSSLWQKKRRYKLKCNPLCELCEMPTPATSIDHIISLESGGAPYDDDNLQSLCSKCHAIKSAKERQYE